MDRYSPEDALTESAIACCGHADFFSVGDFKRDYRSALPTVHMKYLAAILTRHVDRRRGRGKGKLPEPDLNIAIRRYCLATDQSAAFQNKFYIAFKSGFESFSRFAADLSPFCVREP